MLVDVEFIVDKNFEPMLFPVYPLVRHLIDLICLRQALKSLGAYTPLIIDFHLGRHLTRSHHANKLL